MDDQAIFKWLDEQSDQELTDIVLLDVAKAKWSEAQRAVDGVADWVEGSASQIRIEVQALEHSPGEDTGEENLEATEDGQQTEGQATKHKGLRGLWDRLRGKGLKESGVEGAQQASYAMVSAQIDDLRDALEQRDETMFNLVKDKMQVKGTEFTKHLEEYDWSRVEEFSSGADAKDWFESKQEQFNRIGPDVDGMDSPEHSAIEEMFRNAGRTMEYMALVDALEIPDSREFGEEMRRLNGLQDAIEMTMHRMAPTIVDEDQADSQEDHQERGAEEHQEEDKEEFMQTTAAMAAMAAEQSSWQEADDVY